MTLTPAERRVLGCIVNAWDGWVDLPNRTRDDDREFRLAIHQLQSLMAVRVARRVDPDFWLDP